VAVTDEGIRMPMDRRAGVGLTSMREGRKSSGDIALPRRRPRAPRVHGRVPPATRADERRGTADGVTDDGGARSRETRMGRFADDGDLAGHDASLIADDQVFRDGLRA